MVVFSISSDKKGIPITSDINFYITISYMFYINLTIIQENQMCRNGNKNYGVCGGMVCLVQSLIYKKKSEPGY